MGGLKYLHILRNKITLSPLIAIIYLTLWSQCLRLLSEEKRLTNSASTHVSLTCRESLLCTVGLLGCSLVAAAPLLSFPIPLTIIVGFSGLNALTYWDKERCSEIELSCEDRNSCCDKRSELPFTSWHSWYYVVRVVVQAWSKEMRRHYCYQKLKIDRL